jgi:hypothetical protein
MVGLALLGQNLMRYLARLFNNVTLGDKGHTKRFSQRHQIIFVHRARRNNITIKNDWKNHIQHLIDDITI